MVTKGHVGVGFLMYVFLLYSYSQIDVEFIFLLKLEFLIYFLVLVVNFFVLLTLS